MGKGQQGQEEEAGRGKSTRHRSTEIGAMGRNPQPYLGQCSAQTHPIQSKIELGAGRKPRSHAGDLNETGSFPRFKEPSKVRILGRHHHGHSFIIGLQVQSAIPQCFQHLGASIRGDLGRKAKPHRRMRSGADVSRDSPRVGRPDHFYFVAVLVGGRF